MARDQQRDRVVGERGADRPHRRRAADLRGDPAVRPDLAARDLQRLQEDGPFELSPAAQVDGDPGAAVPTQSPGDGRAEPWWKAARRATDRSPDARPEGPLEGLRACGGRQRRHAPAVPGDPDLADRRRERSVVVGQAGGDEGVGQQRRRGGGAQIVERGLDRRLEADLAQLATGLVDVGVFIHAIDSSRSAATRASRSSARPRWTWALTVPSGRPRASLISGYDKPSTCRSTIAARYRSGRAASRATHASADSRRST